MVVLLATGMVPPVIAAMLAAGAMIVLRVVTVQQAYRGISWTTVLLVAGMIPMSTAMTTSGAGAGGRERHRRRRRRPRAHACCSLPCSW